jgi:hypothetical protein
MSGSPFKLAMVATLVNTEMAQFRSPITGSG